MRADLVQLSAVPMHPLAVKGRRAAVAELGEERHEAEFPEQEWRRLSFVFRRLFTTGDLLEVGLGRRRLAPLLAVAHGRQRPDRHCVVDLIETPQAAEALDFPDRAFDTVVCLEGLERLRAEALPRALEQLRRVCRGRLLLCLPYLDPRARHGAFDADRVQALFPQARLFLLLTEQPPRVPALLIEERVS